MEIINKYPIFINDRKLDAQEIYHLTPYFSEFIYLEKDKIPNNCFYYELKKGLGFKSDDLFLGPIDFFKNLRNFPKILNSKRKELLAKSIGLDHLKSNGRVIDMTCGLGSDSLKITYWGGAVLSFERNFVSYLLTNDALQRLSEISTDKIFKLEHGEFIGKQEVESMRDTVIYYDPMYPDSNKKSLPSGNIQVLRSVIGEDVDIESQIASVLDLRPKRFVMKRPKKGMILFESRLHHQIVGSSTRFDIYT